MGPNTGPKSGPTEKIPRARPLCSGGMTSAIVPAPTVPGPEAATPFRKRKARNMPVLVAWEQPTRKAIEVVMHT